MHPPMVRFLYRASQHSGDVTSRTISETPAAQYGLKARCCSWRIACSRPTTRLRPAQFTAKGRIDAAALNPTSPAWSAARVSLTERLRPPNLSIVISSPTSATVLAALFTRAAGPSSTVGSWPIVEDLRPEAPSTLLRG